MKLTKSMLQTKHGKGKSHARKQRREKENSPEEAFHGYGQRVGIFGMLQDYDDAMQEAQKDELIDHYKRRGTFAEYWEQQLAKQKGDT